MMESGTEKHWREQREQEMAEWRAWRCPTCGKPHTETSTGYQAFNVLMMNDDSGLQRMSVGNCSGRWMGMIGQE